MVSRDSDLAGTVALVTGAAGGIGSATVRTLLELGSTVIAADLPGTDFGPLRASVAAPDRLDTREVDISAEASVQALLAAVRSDHGRLDVLDNNAGVTNKAAFDFDVVNMDVTMWDEIQAVNVRGTMLMCKHAVPLMIDSGGGSIINISSDQGLSGDTMTVAYGTSKGGINSMTRFIAAAYGKHGVRCNTVAPGMISSETMLATIPEAIQQIFIDACLIPRLGQPEDVAELVAFLASKRSSYITGQLLQVDGGILAHLPTMAPLNTLFSQAAAQ
ncbi:SDR family oxidoreductase [Mycobacterium porcinum]|uniref:SDR family oxidoreductase n=1 Tax=Mycolicibacterium porcinum TaxID=39693 RepID=A0AAW5T0P1_9MYCO|nr:SDR family oxidoreductase [Mycolicibacterium porcinum]ORB43377.1 SDR family oxidoreductase [Mycolicibacterium porcinum]CDO31214.1 short-chain type dehydrogenase/reductase [Mycolicibacterium vulneris]